MRGADQRPVGLWLLYQSIARCVTAWCCATARHRLAQVLDIANHSVVGFEVLVHTALTVKTSNQIAYSSGGCPGNEKVVHSNGTPRRTLFIPLWPHERITNRSRLRTFGSHQRVVTVWRPILVHVEDGRVASPNLVQNLVRLGATAATQSD